jgi:hypothetical protein
MAQRTTAFIPRSVFEGDTISPNINDTDGDSLIVALASAANPTVYPRPIAASASDPHPSTKPYSHSHHHHQRYHPMSSGLWSPASRS